MEKTEKTLEVKYSESLEEIESLKKEIAYLKEMLDYFRRQKFAPKSEKTSKIIDLDQMSIFDEAEAISCEEKEETNEEDLIEVKTHKRKKKSTRKDQISENIPHEKRLIPLEEDTCDKCENKLQTIAEEFVRSEIEYIPASLKVIDYYRQVKACKSCRKEESQNYIKKAEVPVALLPHSLASPSIISEVTHKKYSLGLPLYRQELEWEQIGLSLSRQTMSNWLLKTYDYWLEPVIEKLKEQMKQENLLHADETPVQVLKEKERSNEKKSTMWVFTTGKKSERPIRLFHYDQSRSGEVAKNYLEGYKGILQTDGYSGYKKLDNKQIGCWAHLRRYFKEALPRSQTEEDSRAKKAIKDINKLFKLEEDWDKKDKEELLKMREEKEKPIIEAFFKWAKDNKNKVAPRSKLGKAINYALNQEEKLKNYLTEAESSLSNNLAENAIRPFVIGRKNWLFCGSPKGARASAGIYSIIETAKANGLKPRKYLNYLLTNITKDGYIPSDELIESLLPWKEEVKKECR